VLIRRCAWHRTYHGYPLVSGVASWRGWTVSFTDGMCPGCAARYRREWNLPRFDGLETAVGWSLLGAALPRAAVALVALLTLVLASRPLDDLRIVRTVTAPPPVALALRTLADEAPPPALAVPSAPRRVAQTRRSAVARLVVPRSLAAIPRPVVRLVVKRPVDLRPAVERPVDLRPAVERPAYSPPADTPRTTFVIARAPVHAGLTVQTP
jgi:hypothetical protein